MILSKSNDVSGNTFTTNAAVITSGSAENVKDPDFSKNIVSSSASYFIDCGATTLTEYVGVHGLSLPIGTVVTLKDGVTVVDTFTTTRDAANITFYLSTPRSFTNLRVDFSGAGEKIVSYIQAGLTTIVDWGVNTGKSLAYFANNRKTRTAINQNGQPTARIIEKISPKLSLIIKNPDKTWIRGDLQEVFTHYNTDGVVSIRDYEDDNFPDDSVAAFDLNGDTISAHGQTKVIVNVKLNFRVSV